MELLEGETLSDRLAKGSLPLSHTLRFGVEIADALDKAHRQGIVHRDLKPGNVMLTKSGVKLLDFGLAKAMAPAAPPSGATSLPTVMGKGGENLTQEGTILGTFQYMSPEQLEGKEADGRTDIFAFGCVLYEMATGRKAFTGSSQASLISSIMKEEPAPVSVVLADFAAGARPRHPEGALEGSRRSLAERGRSRQRAEMDRRGRLGERHRRAGASGAAEAARVVAVGRGAPARGGRVRRGPPGSPRPRGLRHALFDRASARDGSGSLDFARDLARRLDARLRRDGIRPEAPALGSPDGRFRRAAARRNGRRHGPVLVSRRPLDRVLRGPQAQAHPVRGRRGSDDLRRVGRPRSARGASTTSSSLRRRSFGGLFAGRRPRAAPRWPSRAWRARAGRIAFRGFCRTASICSIWLARRPRTSTSTHRSRCSTSRPASPRSWPGKAARDASSSPGTSSFVREGNLLAQPFDRKTLKTTGPAVPIAEGVAFEAFRWVGKFAISNTGRLVYQSNEAIRRRAG